MGRDETGYVTVKDAAEFLGVSPNTLRSWGAAGKIPEYRHPMNNYRLYKKKDLEKLIERLKRPVKVTRGKNRFKGKSRKGSTQK